MTASETSLLNSGQRVGLAIAKFPDELADFAPLHDADTERATVVAAIEAKQAAQDGTTAPATSAKDAAREVLARTAQTLSTRAVSYALATKQLGLKLGFTLSYTDVRYGEATEDVNHVRELVAKVQALPAAVRKLYRLTDAIIQAPLDAAQAFEATADDQTDAAAVTHLATLALPELLRRLSAALLLMKTLVAGQRDDPDPDFHWADLDTAFAAANKRQQVAAKRRPVVQGPRIVRTLPFTQPDGHARRLANTNYGPAYTLTVENHSANDLRLWMGQKDNAPTTPGHCPAGKVTVLTRADIGPETARYLVAQFDGDGGGSATVVIRKVVE